MNEQSRFAHVSRRRLLALAALGTVGAVAGCGNDDSSALGAGRGGTSGGAPTGGPSATAPSPAPGSATPSSRPAGTPLPDSARATIAVTFAASGGMVKNPYLAVWLEDASGALVKTVAVWFEQGKGTRWLPELKRWTSVSGGSTTATGATRRAGAYTLQWDGTDDAGSRVAQGDYFVCVEGAREHGSYELIRQKVTFGASSLDTTLTPNGDLTAASVAYAV